ncbi:MAG: class I SAM-dependent methyltransferase [Flavobacteriales bacterium]|nr:class I SAM-dependent methyltransferase [Flavobacteriales bacterium]
MLEYSEKPKKEIEFNDVRIASFVSDSDQNIDVDTVNSFGEEWTKFSSFSDEEIKNAGDQYFDIVTEEICNSSSVALDMGCGTGRWSKYLADKVKFIEAIDPSKAVLSASHLTKDLKNVRVTQAGVDSIPFADESFDFAMGVGVYHHIPDTQKAVRDTVRKIKKGGYLLIYLYYSLDNRGAGYKFLFKMSTIIRKIVSSMPNRLKKITCDFIAFFVYMPCVLLARLFKILSPKGRTWKKIPLSYYHDKSWNIIKNDALDRFGTPLEQRFSKKELIEILESCGMEDVVVSDGLPYWHAVSRKMK